MVSVAALSMTRERWAQITELLSDEQRLRAEFPKVAEYLDAADALPGTGDDDADASFNLRLIHFMTGDLSDSANPYWDIVAESVFEDGDRRVVNGGNAQGSSRLAFAQMMLQAAYAYAIPSPETVDWVAHFCGGRRIVELGAGRGYWAAQISRAGLTVEAFELEPPGETNNVSFPQAMGQVNTWHPVGVIDALSFEDRSEDVLFLCWPPGWGNTMASEALSAFESAGGSRLVFIGEPKGGKTGDDAFFDALSEHWTLSSADSRFVSWWNLADVAQGWVRR
jgi:hypothetical protein